MIFIDTWAWVALAIPEDQHHKEAVDTYTYLRALRQQLVTSDYILCETITFLYGRVPSESAAGFIDGLTSSIDQGRLLIAPVSQAYFKSAWSMRKKYADKPDISFTDFTSMAVMDAMGISNIFTGDDHFVKVNRGYYLFKNRP